MPALTLDHVLVYGDVDRLVARVRDTVGAAPDDEGVHPGRGTRNAVFVTPGEQALEFIGADPAQDAPPAWAPAVPSGDGVLWWWAVRTDAPVDETRVWLRAEGIDTIGPEQGSRVRPDGDRLAWTLLDPVTSFDTAMPFVIRWDGGAPPWGLVEPRCRIDGFRVHHPAADDLRSLFARLGLDVSVESAAAPGLEVVLTGPSGAVRFASG